MDIVLIVIGIVLGPVINYAIFEFAYDRRQVSPWQRPILIPNAATAEIVSARAWYHYLPVVGWVLPGGAFRTIGIWLPIRSMLIEIAFPIVLLLVYRHVLAGGLMPPGATPIPHKVLLAQFFNVAILFTLLVVATFIDFDERTIPDLITVPGTLIGLLGGAFFPYWRLHVPQPGIVLQTAELHPNSPDGWPIEWGRGATFGLAIAIICWLGWCFGLLNRRWITRRGWSKACGYFFESLRRDPWTIRVGVMGVVGSVAIVACHWGLSPQGWEGLLSSLMGIALGGGLVWSFRLVASWSMGREALGFGDVTLMAMVGAYSGWQLVWISFFVSPFFALLFVIVMWVVTRDSSTPFGPYLAMGVSYVLWKWSEVWNVAALVLPPLSVLVVYWGAMSFLMVLILGVIQIAKTLFRILLFRDRTAT